MKEQADIAQKAGCHRHDDTLPLVVAVRGQRSDICWTSIVLLLESICPKTCWNRVRQTGTCRGKAPPSCYARPFCRLKAPLGLSLFRFAPQTRTCRGEAPPSCCARPFCRLKAPLGLSLLRCAAQTRIWCVLYKFFPIHSSSFMESLFFSSSSLAVA